MLVAKNDDIAHLYVLESVNIVRKYIAFLDIFASDNA